jgi:hypothetical protein
LASPILSADICGCPTPAPPVPKAPDDNNVVDNGEDSYIVGNCNDHTMTPTWEQYGTICNKDDKQADNNEDREIGNNFDAKARMQDSGANYAMPSAVLSKLVRLAEMHSSSARGCWNK